MVCFEKNCERFCNKTPHTECYPAGGGDDCKNNEKVYLSTDEKREILNFHNSKRSKESESGLNMKSSNMMKLAWSGEMGMLAKRWADQCKEGRHDECRTSRNGSKTGQNSYMGIFKNTKSISEQKVKERFDRIKMMLKTWYGEIGLVRETDIRSFDKNRAADIGNVTQILWAETMYIGCGYTEFTLEDDFLMFRFVCDYEPSGNIHSKAVFAEGTPCSKCPQGSQCSESFPELCRRNDEPKNDFIDDSKAHISKPAFYTTSMFAFMALLRVFLVFF